MIEQSNGRQKAIVEVSQEVVPMPAEQVMYLLASIEKHV